jgi:hypothetical protein
VTVELAQWEPPNSVSNRWRPFVAVPAPAQAVTWCQFSWDNRGVQQYGIELRSERAPWRDLLAALDDLGRELADSPVPVEDEADAIVACCWRYGSYFDLLTGGELFPPFRADTSLSRLGDSEMQRINLEYSSGVAAWLGDREQAASRIRRRVRAALAHLPMPWRDGRDGGRLEGIRRSVQRRGERLAALREDEGYLALLHRDAPHVEEHLQQRREANDAVNSTYRNGPIENFHAGTWSHGSEIPGFMRFYPGEVRELAGDAAVKMTAHLIWREQGDSDLRRLLQTVTAPSAWSVTAETSNVRFSGLPGAGPLEERIRSLAARYPHRYGVVLPIE